MDYQKLLQEVASIALKCGRDPKTITVVAVTKGHSWQEVSPILSGGGTHFGENRVQEAFEKMSVAPEGLSWHLIGSLQRKKVPQILGRFSLIHSVDSFELLEAIAKRSEAANLVTSVLLQSNTSGEESKSGLTPDQWEVLFPAALLLSGISIEGFMTMAPLTEEEPLIRATFRKLRLLRDTLQSKYSHPLPHLSMGMSSDYPIAIEEGATILRIGSLLF